MSEHFDLYQGRGKWETWPHMGEQRAWISRIPLFPGSFGYSGIDDWLDKYLASGFFAFHKPGSDRVMANWFLVAEKGSPLISKLKNAYVSYFLDNRFENEGFFRGLLVKTMHRLLKKNEKRARIWLTPFVVKVLRVHPYFAFHYLFEQLVSSDVECREIWNNTKKVDAIPLFRFLQIDAAAPLSGSLKAEIDEVGMPMYKLSWKVDYSDCDSSSALSYLLGK